LPLSAERKARFREEATITFENSCIARDILPALVTDRGEGFHKLGLNNITDRIWFVEPPDRAFDGHVFAAPSGATYGIAVAEAESQLVLRRLVELAGTYPEHIREIAAAPEEADIDRILFEMSSIGFHPDAILTNIYQSHRFWEFRQFRPTGVQRRGLKSPEGSFRDVPVYRSRLLRPGVTVVVDKEQLGNLEIKKDFTISVSDISDDIERRAIRERYSGFDPAEKVRILCYEIVKPVLRHENNLASFIILRTRGSGLDIGPPEV
jgi:hypothetical protein